MVKTVASSRDLGAVVDEKYRTKGKHLNEERGPKVKKREKGKLQS